MGKNNSLGNRLIAVVLSIFMVVGMIPANVFAEEITAVAQIGDVTYDTLADAIAAVPTGTNQVAPSEATTVKLLRDTVCAFDVGISNGASTMNIKLDLNGKTLTLAPGVGSAGTKANGIRVLAYSKLEIANGTIVCSNEAADNIKVGIANYGELTLDSVLLKAGSQTQYTVNNRGTLTLKGKTAITSGSVCAVTNDPYDLYYTTDVNATVTCNSSEVSVESVLVERYARNSANQGGVELNISAGYFGKIVEDGSSSVPASYTVTGGTIGVSNSEELEFALNIISAGAEYACPESAVKIKLLNSMTGSFDVGTSNGKAPKNILLDLNGNTLTLCPSVGSVGTKSNGIRVLAYSKLEIKNGTLICSSEENDNVKVGIANYSDLTLDSVEVKSGDLTIYTINNRGNLTLKGATSVENGKAVQSDYTDSTDYIAITNDPYNLYYATPINAEINCTDGNVVVGNIQLETYGSAGDIELNVTDGSFGGIYAPAAEGAVIVKGAISGGSFGTDISKYCDEKFAAVLVDGKYVAQYVKDDQIDFGFSEEDVTVTYNNTGENKYIFAVLNAKGTVTYSVDNPGVYATIDSSTGELTVIKPGVVTVTALDTGNALYNAAEATCKLTILKENQEISFAAQVPEDQWVGAPFMNTASGGNGIGEITYSLYWSEKDAYVTEIPDVAKIDPKNGELTFLCAGIQVTVCAVKAEDDYYNSAEATYNVTATKRDPEEIAFATTGPISFTYDPENLSFKNEMVGCNADDIITWSVVSGNDVANLDADTGTLEINKAGTIVIRAVVAESPYFYEKTLEYTLVITPANQELLTKQSIPTQITYSPDVQEGLIIGAGGSGTGAYGYKIVEGGEFAEINERTGAIKILKAGYFVDDAFVNGVIKVEITKAGDECYLAAEPITVVITLVRADQSGFGFGENNTATVTYNENSNRFDLNVTGGQSTKTVEFVVLQTENEACVTVNNSGRVSIVCAGTACIQAIKPADDCYNAITDDFTLVIEKDEQDYALTKTGTVSLNYGTLTYENPLIQGTCISAEKKPVYTISDNNIGASVDAETGEVTFKSSEAKVGKATVTVTVAEDACYKSFKASYEIAVSYLAAPDEICSLSGKKAMQDSESDWFVKDLLISAPKGYKISFDNDLSSANNWELAQPYSEPGETTAKVYLKRISDGAITDAIYVPVKYDSTAPGNLKIDYKSDFFQVVLQKIFMLTKGEVTVEFSAEDAESGIAKVEYSLDNGKTFETVEENQGVYSIVIASEMKDHVALRVTNGAGVVAEVLDDQKTLVIDKTSPIITAVYGGEYTLENGVYYTKGTDFAITFRVEDLNFSDIMNQGTDSTEKSLPVVTVNGTVENLNWTDVSGAGEALLPLTAEGDYEIVVTSTDRLNAAEPYKVVVHVDRTLPSIKPVVFAPGEVKNTTADGRNYYNEAQTAKIVIEEQNFDAEKVEIFITVGGEAVSAADYIKTGWTSVGNEHTLVLEFDEDENYTLDVACVDIPGNAAEDYATDLFTVDTVKPDETAMSIEYKTLQFPDFLNGLFGFAQESVEVTIKASDITAGIKKLSYSCDGINFTEVEGDRHTFNIPAQYEGKIVLRATDYSGWTTEFQDGKTVIVDKINPKVQISYDATNRKDRIKADNAATASDRQTMATSTEQTRFVYDGDIIATLRVDEKYFYSNQVKVTVTRDGVELVESTVITADSYYGSEWTEAEQDGEKYHVKTLTFSGDGDYRIAVEYTDESGNGMDWSTSEYTGWNKSKYVSNIHTIDTTPPEVTLVYTDTDSNIANTNYHSENRTATITVVDRNFRPNEVVFKVEAFDVNSKEVNTFDYSSLKLTSWSDQGNLIWKQIDTNTWQTNVEIPFYLDGNYTVALGYKDIAKNDANITPYEAEFTIDHVAPQDLSIEYSKNALDEIWESITFGYWEVPRTVTLTAKDVTAGIEYFTISAKSQGPQSATDIVLPENLKINVADGSLDNESTFLGDGKDITITEENGSVSISFQVPAQFRGVFEFSATDKAANLTDKKDNAQIQVVDTNPPKRTVKYQPTATVDAATLKTVDKAVEEGDNVILYYNGEAKAYIEIVEANFIPEDVRVMVNGALVAVDGDWITPEGSADDVWTNTLTLTGDGDYVITVEYEDKSKNKMETYTSQLIIIDTDEPEIYVNYSNTDVKNTIEEREYFSAEQTAIITIKEHNFRADDVKIKVKAENVLGETVLELNTDGTVAAYADQGRNRGSWSAYENGTWRRNDNTYEIVLNYTADANYSFDIEYEDLAKNKAEDYTEDLFTVDTTKPQNLKVDFSTSFHEQIKETIYYNAMMTVTITAEDETSGIYHFMYSYVNGENVSGVNAELWNQAIEKAEITYNGKTATATFSIPKMVLGDDNQFNGTVEFTAFDRSENSNDTKDDRVIVVDNISPKSTITYNNPVQSTNGISYYDGDITATIAVTEANFDENDVVVSVTRNGENFPVSVYWRDNSVDNHTGTFTLDKDGDYVVSVQYRDKSGNQMADYTSNQLTLDTESPVITVTNIKANSANKDETYGFVITFDDINLDASAIQPVLEVIKQTEAGRYETVKLDLGNVTTVEKGKTYTYTIENLPDDGLYTLTCQVKDMSANTTSRVILDDGKNYEQVQFSINREGSAFGYGNTFTEELVSKYYIYSVEEDVVIVEVNVDPIDDYVVTLNGQELDEGTEYTTTQSSESGEWSKRTYSVKKSLFDAEGEYSIVVSSKDKTATTAFSDVKNLAVSFVVDQTKPALTITGLEAGGRYQTDAQTVTLIPTDEGGRLNSLIVVVLDSDGNPLKDESGADISVRVAMAGEELLNYLEENDGKITFTIPEGLNNQVKIVCSDCALDENNMPNEYNELFEDVTVSQNRFIIFYANTPLFVSTVIIVVAAIVIIAFLIKRKISKKKRATKV